MSAADLAPTTVDLRGRRRVHVCNVGGAGMSAIAIVLSQMGHAVSGDDANDTPFLVRARAEAVAVHVGAPTAIAGAGAADADVVVLSTATPMDHPAVAGARDRGAQVVHRRDVLASIGQMRSVLAVAGTHGKSTTSAMLATAFDGAGWGTGYLVGTTILGLASNADWRDGPGFVVEADESDGTFLRLGATHAIVTNVEADHLGYWGTEQALFAAFDRFVAEVTGTVVLCRDDARARALSAGARHPVTYGTSADADHRILDVVRDGLGIRYRHVDTLTGREVEVHVPTAPGLHNARNAAGAIALATTVGVDLGAAASALGAFGGVARRFERRGEAGGVTFVDSYDHLPTEVEAALAAARAAGFARVVCVFQPHRYTRTRDLGHTFADSFVGVDILAVTDVYPAGEPPIEGVSGRSVADAVRRAHPEAEVVDVTDLAAVEEFLVDVLRPGDLCITLNAGDLTRVPDRVMARLGGAPEERGPR